MAKVEGREPGTGAGEPKRGVILVYHGIGTPNSAANWRERKYWVASDTFREHVSAIACRHALVTVDQFWTGSARDRNPVALTFDDGLASDYSVAWPTLQAATVPATFFLNTATIGNAGYLSWAQAREMQCAGISFESHGHDHIYLTVLPFSRIKAYLLDSKRRLEDGLGRSVSCFAPPYGDLNRELVEAALECGFRAVCASGERPATPGASLLDRVAVYRSTTARTVTRLAAADQWYLTARRVRAAAIYLPKQLFLCWRRPADKVADSVRTVAAGGGN